MQFRHILIALIVPQQQQVAMAADGCQQVVEIMHREFENGMALTGATNIAELQENGARLRI